MDHNSSLDANNNNTDLIPIDIVNEILQKLPAKSIAKFVILSKSWANIIRSNYFINSFSSLQEQQQPHPLLFAINQNFDFNWSFFSLSSNDVKPKFISRIPKFDGCSHSPIYVNGLVNFRFGRLQMIISNPSTGKSIVLPVVVKGNILSRRFFGFDPINGEYKVLCIIGSMYGLRGRITPCHNQVLTVGSNSFWREIDLWIPHRPRSKSVCIDGIIYYLASDLELIILVRFDVRTEKFLKPLPCLFLKSFKRLLNLINYKSKLAIPNKPNYHSIDLWVFEDAEKVEWSKISRSLIAGCAIEIFGTTRSDEIVYTCVDPNGNGKFYIIYQDQDDKKNQHRIVETSKARGRGFNDYVESVMLL